MASALRRSCVALLLPDSGKPSSKPNRLVIPGTRTAQQNAKPVTQLVTESPDGDAKRTFRPPMGYFLKTKDTAEVAELNVEVMIQKLSAGTGLWHTLATYFPQLNAMGYDSALIEEMTGFPKGEQSVMVTAVSVLESIRGYCKEHTTKDTEAMLPFYDLEGTHFMLYELRFLDVEERVTCARYVAEHQLNGEDTRDLARSTKEYHRRGAEEMGFLPTPEDILAFKFYRNALESREQSLISTFVEKGLGIAQSDGARQKLEAVLVGHEKILKEEDPSVAAKIQIYRLLSDESRMRLLPYAGDLFEVEGSILRHCPKARSIGEFNIFDVGKVGSKHDWKWMALPNWAFLSHAKCPVALSIKNCVQVPELRSSIKAKSKDAALRLSGSGMLVVDTADKDMDGEFYYLCNHDSKLKLQPGHQLIEADIVGKVLFVCRPPDKNSEF